MGNITHAQRMKTRYQPQVSTEGYGCLWAFWLMYAVIFTIDNIQIYIYSNTIMVDK